MVYMSDTFVSEIPFQLNYCLENLFLRNTSNSSVVVRIFTSSPAFRGLNADKHLLSRLDDNCALLGCYEACNPDKRLGGGSLISHLLCRLDSEVIFYLK
jgi:hypothetical protein